MIPQAQPGHDAPAPAGGRLTQLNFAFLQKYVYSASGIVLDESKQYLLEARLLPLVEQSKLRSLNALSELLAARLTDPLGRLVVEAMTTNETLFFRDPACFEAIRLHVLPELFKTMHPPHKLRIWSAASSSGQEAYSLAMLLLESGRTQRDVEIVGTDLSTQVLARAREGSYTLFETNRGLTESMLSRYFVRKGQDWQIKEAAKKMVCFQQLNLRSSFEKLGTFDLILCRNVLIYFDTATKADIIGRMTPLLNDGGLLTLGATESILSVKSVLQRKQVGHCTFYTRGSGGA